MVAFHKIKVLIADDQPLFREGIRASLRRFPQFSNSGEADCYDAYIKLIRRQSPDVVIINLEAGEEAALDFTEKRYPEIKLLALSSFPAHRDWLRSSRANHAFLLASRDKETSHQRMTLIDVCQSMLETNTFLMLHAFLTNMQSTARIKSLLTVREEQVLVLLCLGHTSKETGERLFINSRTVETHRENIFKKIGSACPFDLVLYILRHNLMDKYDYRKRSEKNNLVNKLEVASQRF